MNRREKEEYLRQYAILKAKGKPFFPYAVAKDGAMACVVMAVIITLSLVLGAGQGPKPNPTTTSYVPRPDWYFFFLFELLRVVKPANLTHIASRLTSGTIIARTLVNPTAPMPSFKNLPANKFKAAVEFLSQLK